MNKLFPTLAALALLATPALAVDLPPICRVDAPQVDQSGSMAMLMPPMTMADMAHEELMAGMDRMNDDMKTGGSAADIDVAFVCAMLPHHQGAIDMAKAELKHGNSPWAKELAETIIAAQEKEITEMLDWLDRQPE